jgi:hypothetical protein
MDQLAVSNISMTKPSHWIVKAAVFSVLSSLVLMSSFVLLTAVVLNGQPVPNETGAGATMGATDGIQYVYVPYLEYLAIIIR